MPSGHQILQNDTTCVFPVHPGMFRSIRLIAEHGRCVAKKQGLLVTTELAEGARLPGAARKVRCNYGAL